VADEEHRDVRLLLPLDEVLTECLEELVALELLVPERLERVLEENLEL